MLQFKSKKNYRLIKELAERLEDRIDPAQKGVAAAKERKSSGSKTGLTEQELRNMGGMMRGQLISKAHVRSKSWKKRA